MNPWRSRQPAHKQIQAMRETAHSFRKSTAQRRPRSPQKNSHSMVFFLKLGLFLSQQELTSRGSHRFSNVPAIPTCHSWAQGRGRKGRRQSGAGGMVAAGERCSWPRSVLSFPQKAVGGWWIVLALLAGPAQSTWSGQVRSGQVRSGILLGQSLGP
jgi:hypothetical protein